MFYQVKALWDRTPKNGVFSETRVRPTLFEDKRYE